jgi:hypothetical protein
VVTPVYRFCYGAGNSMDSGALGIPSGRTVWNRTYSFSCISASLRSSAIPLWPCFSDWAIPFS